MPNSDKLFNCFCAVGTNRYLDFSLSLDITRWMRNNVKTIIKNCCLSNRVDVHSSNVTMEEGTSGEDFLSVFFGFTLWLSQKTDFMILDFLRVGND